MARPHAIGSDSDSLSHSEREILALYDQNVDAGTIAVRLGYDLARVKDTIARLSGHVNRKDEERIATGSLALLVAIQRTGRMHA